MGMIRTGAASGIAARSLARPDARVAGVFGAGWQAEGHVRAICAALPLERVKAAHPLPQECESNLAAALGRLDAQKWSAAKFFE